MKTGGKVVDNEILVNEWLCTGVTQSEIARRLGVSRTAITAFVKRNKIVYTRICPRTDCRKEFSTSDVTKIYCCRKCARTDSNRKLKGIACEKVYCKLHDYGECDKQFFSTGDKKFCSKKHGGRYEYLARQEEIFKTGLKCEVCGETLVFDFHHVEERKNGGADEPKNITVLCPNHHVAIHRGRAKLGKDLIYVLGEQCIKIRTLDEIGVPDWYDKYINDNRPR